MSYIGWCLDGLGKRLEKGTVRWGGNKKIPISSFYLQFQQLCAWLLVVHRWNFSFYRTIARVLHVWIIVFFHIFTVHFLSEFLSYLSRSSCEPSTFDTSTLCKLKVMIPGKVTIFSPMLKLMIFGTKNDTLPKPFYLPQGKLGRYSLP